VASIVASRAGVSKTAVNKIFSVLRRRDLDAYEILAMFIANKENIGRDQARRTLRCLMELVIQVTGTETKAVATVERGDR
jgi:Fe2+ or Zn2+ uptake regulation protein